MHCSVIRLKRRPEMRLRPALAVVGCTVAALIAVPGTAFADETVTAHLSSSNPTVGQELTIDGDVSGAMSESMITATRQDSTGPNPIPGTTTTQGHFQLKDTPPARGQAVYHITADGSASTDVTVTVAGKKVDLTIRVSPSPADVGSTVHVVGHLGSMTTNRNLTLYATPYGGSRQQFDSGPVDAGGDRAADRAVHRRTTFTAAFAGDTAYAPATARVTLRVRAVIDEKLRGGYATRRGYRLYRAHDTVNVFIHLTPEHKGTCLIMQAQRRSSGSWHNAVESKCDSQAVRTDGHGEVIAQLTPPHRVGVPYRLRAVFRGTSAVDGRKGAWMHLKFR